MDITKKLFELRDEEYADFQSRLTPGIPREKFIGVRMPVVRKLAKEVYKTGECRPFLDSLPHEYYDENVLHGAIISVIDDYDECVQRLDEFLPYVDNWAVCDTIHPKAFIKKKRESFGKILEWSASDQTFVCRFGIETLMHLYLDEDFKPEYLEIPAIVQTEEYYVKMMVAWFFAEALVKQWDSAVKYITENRLERWTHNKTIQKACESYRISDEQKKYLKTFRR